MLSPVPLFDVVTLSGRSLSDERILLSLISPRFVDHLLDIIIKRVHAFLTSLLIMALPPYRSARCPLDLLCIQSTCARCMVQFLVFAEYSVGTRSVPLRSCSSSHPVSYQNLFSPNQTMRHQAMPSVEDEVAPVFTHLHMDRRHAAAVFEMAHERQDARVGRPTINDDRSDR